MSVLLQRIFEQRVFCLSFFVFTVYTVLAHTVFADTRVPGIYPLRASAAGPRPHSPADYCARPLLAAHRVFVRARELLHA